MGPEFFRRLEEEWLEEEKNADRALQKSKAEQQKLKERLSTAYGRFGWRIEEWEKKKGSALGHHFWWFVHNCIAHPMIGLVPIKKTFEFHDYTSDKINCK